MPDLSIFIPPGYDTKTERSLFFAALIGSTLFSFGFFVNLIGELDRLYRQLEGASPDTHHFVMEDFTILSEHCFLGFALLALAMLCFVPIRYAYHNQNGSRALYLMRRLPSRWELHRRCILMPVAAALVSLLCALALILLYFAIYLYATPDVWLVPGQWRKLWEELL